MKRILFYLIFCFYTSNSMSITGKLTELKIDSDWKIKYDPAIWTYIYLKPTKGISSNFLEHKKDKFRLVLQKESHIDKITGLESLVDQKCLEANKYYSRSKGQTEVMKINSRKVCHIEYKNLKGNTIHQIVYPENFKNSHYEILSFGWMSNNRKSKDQVSEFLKGFLK